MLNSQCCHLYGAQAWDLSQKAVCDIGTAWNKSARKLLSLPYTTHRTLLPCLVGRDCAIDQAGNRFLKMLKTMLSSDNPVVNTIANSCLADANSIISRNLFYLEKRFHVEAKTLIDSKKQYHCDLCMRDNEDMTIANVIKDLNNCLLLNTLPGFTNGEIREMICCLCIY